MSLLSGMNGMLTNVEAVDTADEILAMESERAMEADMFIDALVDGADSVMEAELKTGKEFLDSLSLDKNDPITTKCGSIGASGHNASFAGNYSDEAADNDDPIKTEWGSIGQEDSAATFDENYAEEFDDDNDPIMTQDGTIGQKNSTAKDPATESMKFFGELLGEETAMESIREAYEADTHAQHLVDRQNDLMSMNVMDLDIKQVSDLAQSGAYEQAIGLTAEFGKTLEIAKEALSTDDIDYLDKTDKLDRYIRSNNALMISLESDRRVSQYVAEGMDATQAKDKVFCDMVASANKQESELKESIMESLNMIKAFEADTDPEATSDGSIGQQDSAAEFGENKAGGNLDENDPIVTKDGGEGDPNAQASFDGNFGGGDLDNDDPIVTKDGSVGQKDSRANVDSATESSIEDELDLLNQSLMESFGEDDM